MRHSRISSSWSLVEIHLHAFEKLGQPLPRYGQQLLLIDRTPGIGVESVADPGQEALQTRMPSADALVRPEAENAVEPTGQTIRCMGDVDLWRYLRQGSRVLAQNRCWHAAAYGHDAVAVDDAAPAQPPSQGIDVEITPQHNGAVVGPLRLGMGAVLSETPAAGEPDAPRRPPGDEAALPDLSGVGVSRSVVDDHKSASASGAGLSTSRTHCSRCRSGAAQENEASCLLHGQVGNRAQGRTRG